MEEEQIQKTTYTPSPSNVDKIELEDELNDLIELLAEDIHENWAKQRIHEGWRYGKHRDDRNKIHPCLVPYNELPESEKEYDRITVATTLKLIRKFGFRFIKSDS